MEKIIVEEISAILFKEQIRLRQVIVMFFTFAQLQPNPFLDAETKKRLEDEYFNFVKNYSNIGLIAGPQNLFHTFISTTPLKGKMFIRYPIQMENYPSYELFVQFKIYKLFYYHLWPALMKVVYENAQASIYEFDFAYNIPFKVIEAIYNENESRFYTEIIGLFELNGFDGAYVSKKEKEEKYQINITI